MLYQDRGPCLFRKVPIKQQKHNREIPNTIRSTFPLDPKRFSLGPRLYQAPVAKREAAGIGIAPRPALPGANTVANLLFEGVPITAKSAGHNERTHSRIRTNATRLCRVFRSFLSSTV